MTPSLQLFSQGKIAFSFPFQVLPSAQHCIESCREKLPHVNFLFFVEFWLNMQEIHPDRQTMATGMLQGNFLDKMLVTTFPVNEHLLILEQILVNIMNMYC